MATSKSKTLIGLPITRPPRPESLYESFEYEAELWTEVREPWHSAWLRISEDIDRFDDYVERDRDILLLHLLSRIDELHRRLDDKGNK